VGTKCGCESYRVVCDLNDRDTFLASITENKEHPTNRDLTDRLPENTKRNFSSCFSNRRKISNGSKFFPAFSGNLLVWSPFMGYSLLLEQVVRLQPDFKYRTRKNIGIEI